MLQTIPSFYAKISEKSLFISATTYEKYIVCKDYCIAHHNEKTCFLPACIYHIVLLGNVQELLKKLDTFASLINTWTVCIHFSSIDSVEKFLQRLDKCLITCNGQLTLIKKQGSGQNAEHCKKETLEEKVQKTFIQLLSKDKSNADQWCSVCRKF